MSSSPSVPASVIAGQLTSSEDLEEKEEDEEYPTMTARELARFFAIGRRAARIAERRWAIYCRLQAAEHDLAKRQAGGKNTQTYGLDTRLHASFDHFEEWGEATFVYEEQWQYGETYRYELPAKILAEKGFEERAAARMAAIAAENAALDASEARAKAVVVAAQARDRQVAERAEYRRLAAKYGQGNQSGDPASDPSSDPS